MKRTSVNRNRAALKKQNRSDRTEHNDRGQRRRQPLGLSPSPRLAGLLIEPPNDPRFRKCVPEILARRLPYATIISKATIRTKSPRNKLGEPIDVVFYRKQRMFYAIISIKDLAFAFKGEGYSQEMIEEGSMSDCIQELVNQTGRSDLSEVFDETLLKERGGIQMVRCIFDVEKRLKDKSK